MRFVGKGGPISHRRTVPIMAILRRLFWLVVFGVHIANGIECNTEQDKRCTSDVKMWRGKGEFGLHRSEVLRGVTRHLAYLRV